MIMSLECLLPEEFGCLNIFHIPTYQYLTAVLQNGRMKGRAWNTIPIGYKPSNFSGKPNPKVLVGFEYVLNNLNKVTILDVRSKEEFDGELVRAARGGSHTNIN